MLITKVSSFTGEMHSMELPVTETQLRELEAGVLIHKVMPHLTMDERGEE